jgi:uncharacterized protein (DUF1778 family)
MTTKEVISMRIAHKDKQALAVAAEREGTTLTGYAIGAITERIRAETIADRLLVAILAALDERTNEIVNRLNVLHERADAAATKTDLSKLAEWIANRTTSNGRVP